MKTQSNNSEQFIRIGTKMINLRFVKSVELRGTSLEVTTPTDDGEGTVTYLLHNEGAEVFDRLKKNCVNSAG